MEWLKYHITSPGENIINIYDDAFNRLNTHVNACCCGGVGSKQLIQIRDETRDGNTHHWSSIKIDFFMSVIMHWSIFSATLRSRFEISIDFGKVFDRCCSRFCSFDQQQQLRRHSFSQFPLFIYFVPSDRPPLPRLHLVHCPIFWSINELWTVKQWLVRSISHRIKSIPKWKNEQMEQFEFFFFVFSIHSWLGESHDVCGDVHASRGQERDSVENNRNCVWRDK